MEIDGDQPPSTPDATGFDTVHAPLVVVGDRGAGWIVEGWDIFSKNLGLWLALAAARICWLLVMDKFKTLAVVDNVFDYVWCAACLLACQAGWLRQSLTSTFVLARFRQQLGRLLVARLLVMVVSLLIIGAGIGDLVWKVMHDEHIQALIKKISTETDFTNPSLMNNVLELDQLIGFNGVLLRLLIISLLVIPVSAAGWFAPALIMLGNCDVKTALWFSLNATMRNLWPFLINGLLLLIMALLALLPWHVGYLVLMPLFYLSMYLSYRDIFVN